MAARTWTVSALAAEAGRPARTIRDHITAGILRATRAGRTWVITDADARRYLSTYRPYDTLRKGRRHVDQ